MNKEKIAKAIWRLKAKAGYRKYHGADSKLEYDLANIATALLIRDEDPYAWRLNPRTKYVHPEYRFGRVWVYGPHEPHHSPDGEMRKFRAGELTQKDIDILAAFTGKKRDFDKVRRARFSSQKRGNYGFIYYLVGKTSPLEIDVVVDGRVKGADPLYSVQDIEQAMDIAEDLGNVGLAQLKSIATPEITVEAVCYAVTLKRGSYAYMDSILLILDVSNGDAESEWASAVIDKIESAPNTSIGFEKIVYEVQKECRKR